MNERPDDAHFQAFLNPKSPDVFRAVLSTNDVWRPDPVDVPSIHADARAAFEALVERVASGSRLDESERLWLVRGEPGAGKTHLISAFRTWLHENGKGFLAYLQMQTGIGDYMRYILYSVVDSLEKAMSERRTRTLRSTSSRARSSPKRSCAATTTMRPSNRAKSPNCCPASTTSSRRTRTSSPRC